MSFLPKGTKIPETNSSYLKLKEGSVKFRVVSSAVVGYIYWTIKDGKNKPIRLREKPTEKPDDIKLNEDGGYSIKYFWAFKVLDRETNEVKILDLTQKSILDQISLYLNDSDWGDPIGYDLTITGTGDGLERRYKTHASPHKPLTKEEQSLVARTEIDLEKLFEGAEPFIAPVEDEVKLEDVPF